MKPYPFKVNLIAPKDVDISGVISKAITETKLNIIMKEIDTYCETDEQRTAMITAIQERLH